MISASKKGHRHTFLQQHHSSEPVIQVPEVDTPYSAFVVQLPIDVERLVRCDLQFPHPLARDGSIFEWWIELVAPRRSVAVPIAVVVTEKVIAVGLRTATDLERLVNRSKEIFCQVWNDGSNGMQVLLCVAGREAAEEITETWMLWSASSRGARLRYVGLGVEETV